MQRTGAIAGAPLIRFVEDLVAGPFVMEPDTEITDVEVRHYLKIAGKDVDPMRAGDRPAGASPRRATRSG